MRCPSGRAGRLAGMAMRIANREPNRLAIEALGVQPRDTVLELGFGPGHGIKTLASQAHQGCVLGIDISSEMLALAIRLNANAIRQGKVKLHLGNFVHLPWPTSTIDKILAVNVAYFFDRDGQHLQEALRVLRPGGLLSLYATDRETMSKWKFARPDTHRLFDKSELQSLLTRAGFGEEELSIKSVSLSFGVNGYVALGRKTCLSGRA